MTKEQVIMSKPKFISSDEYKNHDRKLVAKKATSKNYEKLSSIADLFDTLKISDGMTLSFHHHLRNGDYVMNMVLEEIKRRNIKNIHLCPSSIFPNNVCLVELIENGNVTSIDTNYINGPVGKAINEGKLEGMLVMHTHGGRARAIESGEIKIDVAILACPTVDLNANGTGSIGKTACGSLGYAISDLEYADKVVLVTDNVVEKLDEYDLDGKYVDYVLKIDSIGNAANIVSGTTRITKDPVGLKIASDTAQLIDELGLIKNGMSMQTGAGGTSLAVADSVKSIMLKNNVKGSFASGGITGYFVQMLEDGLFDHLMDVQCFDLDAVRSYGQNKNHHGMSASLYANPYEDGVIVDKLDFVILGATEIDLNFNVNVTTDSYGNIMGGSGGHSDTAKGAKVTIITTNLIKSRMPIIKNHVTTITTPGEDVDVLVTERGIAINPKRVDLLEKLKNSKLNILSIKELYELSHRITGTPKPLKRTDDIVGIVEYRDGSVIDYIYKTK